MSRLYTKNGRPLRVSGDTVYDETGRKVGRISGSYVYSVSGRYAGTIVEDRVVYRSTDSAHISSASSPTVGSPFADAPAAPSAIWGDEPRFD
jgi:hypothetical protein